MTAYVLAYLLAHSIYSAECCANKDCRPVDCGEITSTPNGWKWNNITFTRDKYRDSPDGNCHTCTSPWPVCIYLPSHV